MKETNRNDPCPCGSGKKYKKCHLPADAEAIREQGETAKGQAKGLGDPAYFKTKPKGQDGKSHHKSGASKGKGRINLPRRSGG